MNYLKFPSTENWKRISSASPFEQLPFYLNELETKNKPEDGLTNSMRYIEISEFILQLRHRLADVQKSYVMLIYYYEKGIPDKEWYISPGKDGASVEYYPHFNESDFIIKDWFDYYSDTFYFKLFSAWDVIGHLINIKYDLKIERKNISFWTAVNKLNKKHNVLYSKLEKIRRNDVFKRARDIRDDITHNYLPSSVGLAVSMNEKGGGLGIREYIPSDEIVQNAQEVVGLFEETLMHMAS